LDDIGCKTQSGERIEQLVFWAWYPDVGVSSSEFQEDECQDATQIKQRVYHLMEANEAVTKSMLAELSLWWQCKSHGPIALCGWRTVIT